MIVNTCNFLTVLNFYTLFNNSLNTIVHIIGSYRGEKEIYDNCMPVIQGEVLHKDMIYCVFGVKPVYVNIQC